ncbi:MAG: hypothetical protein ACRDWT_07780 [Jatrophihabitantaceae bacterium]
MSLIHRIRTALHATGTITFCESCSQVCDSACRANAVRDRAINTALLLGRR